MPYDVRQDGTRYEIVRREDGKVVGTSDTQEKAQRSIGYRMEAERKKAAKGR